MKFIARQQNFRVVLRPSIPGEKLTGRQPVPGLSVKFEGGIANVADDETCKLMLSHERFNIDFILKEEEALDPYYRKPSEPDHNITNIEYGHVGKSINPKPLVQLNADKKKALTEMATEMAKSIAKDMAKEMTMKILPDLVKQGVAEVLASQSKARNLETEKSDSDEQSNGEDDSGDEGTTPPKSPDDDTPKATRGRPKANPDKS